MSESATIGRGVLELTVDATGAQAGLDTTSRSIDAYVRKLQQQAANVGKTAAEIKLQELAQRGANQAQLDAVKAAQRTIDAYRQQQTEARKAAEAAAAAARQQAAAAALASGSLNSVQLAETTHAMRSFIEMVATGQNPLRALATEGFRFSSIMGGISQAFQALRTIFTTTRVVAGSFVAVLGGFAYALYEGTQQAKEFNEAIIKTGNYAGQTAEGFSAMARNVADATRTTVGSVRDIGMALLQSGEIPRDAFAGAVEAATNYMRITGKTAEDTAKDFAEMARDPEKFALQMNKAMHLIESGQYAALHGYQEHEDKVKALAVIFGTINQRAEEVRNSQGALGRTLDEMKGKWSSFWDAVNGMGRGEDIQVRIDQIDQKLNDPEQQQHNQRGLAMLAAEKNGLLAQQQAQDEEARRKSAKDDLNQRAIEGQKFVEDMGKRGKAVSEYNQAIDKLNRSIKANKEAGTPLSDEDIAAAKKGIYNAYADKSAIGDARAKAAEQAAAIKAGYEKQIKDQQNAMQILDAQRSAGLLDEQDYYDQKAQFIERDKDLTVASLEAQRQKFQDIAGKLRGKDFSENAQKIIDLNRQISDAQKKAGTEEILLNIQRTQAIRSVIAAYEAELASAQNALNVQNRAQARDIRAVGLGDEERNRLSRRNAISDNFDAQRVQADEAKAQLLILGQFNDKQKQMYNDRISVIEDYKQKSLASFDEAYAKEKEAEANALNGASRAFQNYMSQAANVAEQTASLITDVFTGFEDTLADTLVKGKGNWKGFFDTIQTDIAKMAIKGGLRDLFDLAKGGTFGDGIAGIANTLAGAGKPKSDLSYVAQTAAIEGNTLAITTNNASLALFNAAVLTATETLAIMAANNVGKSGGDALGAFLDAMGEGHAVGGPVSSGKLYPVNEKGPELLNVAGKQYLMMGGQDGSVTPNNAIGKGAAPTTIVVNVTPPQGASRETAMQFGSAVAKQMQVALRRNG